MKKCSYCGKEYPDDATACSIDAQPLETVAPPQPRRLSPALAILLFSAMLCVAPIGMVLWHRHIHSLRLVVYGVIMSIGALCALRRLVPAVLSKQPNPLDALNSPPLPSLSARVKAGFELEKAG
jgi:hypothetical protein